MGHALGDRRVQVDLPAAVAGQRKDAPHATIIGNTAEEAAAEEVAAEEAVVAGALGTAFVGGVDGHASKRRRLEQAREAVGGTEPEPAHA